MRGFGQKMTPGPCSSAALSSTAARVPSCAMFLSDLREPLGVLRIAAVDDVEERALDLLGDRPARAAAELDAVELADRGHLGRGAGEERLVADVELVAGDALLDQLQAEVAADRQDRVARDAVERACGEIGRVDDALLDHEKVLARAFADEA